MVHMSEIIKENARIRSTGAIIRGNNNKVIGHNNIIYGNRIKGAGNNNRIYGDYCKWKGNFNIAQGQNNQLIGKGNKKGVAAVMENRKRGRDDDDKDDDSKGKEEEEEDDDEKDASPHRQVVDLTGNSNVPLRNVRQRSAATSGGSSDNDAIWPSGFVGVTQTMEYIATDKAHLIPHDALVAASNCNYLPPPVRENFKNLAREHERLGIGNLIAAGVTLTKTPNVERVVRVPAEDKERIDEEADEDAGDAACLACCVNKRKTTNVPSDTEDMECGHHSYCVACARRAYSGKKVGSKAARCPECRAGLTRIILSYIN